MQKNFFSHDKTFSSKIETLKKNLFLKIVDSLIINRRKTGWAITGHAPKFDDLCNVEYLATNFSKNP